MGKMHPVVTPWFSEKVTEEHVWEILDEVDRCCYLHNAVLIDILVKYVNISIFSLKKKKNI